MERLHTGFIIPSDNLSSAREEKPLLKEKIKPKTKINNDKIISKNIVAQNNWTTKIDKAKLPVLEEKKTDTKKTKNSRDEIINFISSFELIHTTAYWDIKQWSIWLWTKSYKWEKISKEEAYRRSYVVIDSIRNKYNLHNEPIEVQKAVTSFIYNLWSLKNNQIRLLKNKKYKALWNNFKQYIYCGWKVCWWLVKRRQAEANLLFNF